jgi:hypothetical protein
MAKRRAMGKDPLGWIGEVAETTEGGRLSSPRVAGRAGLVEADVEEVGERGQAEVPKFLTCEVMTARLRSDQVDFLNALERRIMRSRGRKGERITKNSLLRAAVDVLRSLDFEVRDIESEEELVERLLGVVAGVSGEPAS